MHPNFPTPELESFIQQTLAQWRVPGVAVAVIKDGQTILCEGFGARNLAQNLPVTADTLFPIASCTKAFTATCLALLVDEGKLEWDKPVRHYLPAFKLHDPHATELMTPRDLLCHRSGLPRHDVMWYAANFSRQEVFERLLHLEPNASFRGTWQYQNIMYMVAGLLVQEITGQTWETFVKERIFDVLRMRRSNTSTTVTQADDNHSRPYLYQDEVLREVPFYGTDEKEATGPAGTINSCVSEMAHWLTVHQNGGQWGDKTLISQHNLGEMHKPHVFIDDPQARERLGLDFYSYGLGWFMYTYKGQMLLEHGGNLDGFSSLVSFMPRHNMGVVVLSNGQGVHNAIPHALSFTIYDRLVGLELTNWNERYLEIYGEMHTAMKQSKSKTAEERRPSTPSHALEEYVGEYEHPGYGVYVVRPQTNSSRARSGDRLDQPRQLNPLELIANNKTVMPISHYHYDIFEAQFKEFDMSIKLSFRTDEKGSISGFYTQLEPSVRELFFARRPDPQLSDPVFLSPLTGTYLLQGLQLVVDLKGNTLFARLPDQTMVLVPYRGMEFQVKDQPGFSLTFERDEAGQVHRVLVNQPGYVYAAARQ